MAKLIILRGNSGSGKTTVAKELQKKLGSNTAGGRPLLLSQDVVRRDMLKVKDGPHTEAIPLLIELLKYGHAHSEITILEGILYADWYRPLFELARRLYGNQIYAWYFDLPFQETLRRHQTKPNCNEFGVEAMKRWWREKDFSDVLSENPISAEASLQDIVSEIYQAVQGSDGGKMQSKVNEAVKQYGLSCGTKVLSAPERNRSEKRRSIMNPSERNPHAAMDVQAVVTSFNQGSMILEAVQSLCAQTTPPAEILLVDDGSTDGASLRILEQLESDPSFCVPITVLRQPNGGVSAARNAGIRRAESPLVLVLDGDDRLEPSYIEQVRGLLHDNSAMVAASSRMHTFGVLDATVCPAGGGITAFLSRNCCPATHIFRRAAWEKCGGYDESMRSGFEDWDFFLSLLETAPEAYIGIVPKPLIDYRTAPASSNVKSMEKRLELMRFLIEKHIDAYRAHITEAVLGVESISMTRLFGWENEMLQKLAAGQDLCGTSSEFLQQPSYGDGGMAAAVRIASAFPHLFGEA